MATISSGPPRNPPSAVNRITPPMRYMFVRCSSIRSRIDRVIRPIDAPSAFCPKGACTRTTAMINMATTSMTAAIWLALHFGCWDRHGIGPPQQSFDRTQRRQRHGLASERLARALLDGCEHHLCHRAVLRRTAAVLQRPAQLELRVVEDAQAQPILRPLDAHDQVVRRQA